MRVIFLDHCKLRLRTLALLLICLVVIVPLAGSHIFVSSALQRGEFYAGVALHEGTAQLSVHAAGPVHHQAATAAGHADVSALNLFLHLSGIFVPAISIDWLARPSGSAPAVTVSALPEWELVSAIFEPPKGRASLP
ncbi:MAG TPA: hypothetical protein VGM81_01505 [Burkholderiaceae bacterium]|jgi:hypothetical protein